MADTAVKNASGVNNKGDMPVSYNVDDFAVPGGRDEDWRFISLRRLRGLHNGTFAPLTDARINVEGPSEVIVETVSPDDDRLKAAGGPVDRVAAQAWTGATSGTIVKIPDNAELLSLIHI